MKHVVAAACALSMSAVAGWACNVPTGFGAAPETVVNLTNAFRASERRESLSLSPRLTDAAQAHACDMAETGNFSHTGRGGTDVGQRVTAAGYRWRFVAENIAFGQDFAETAVNGWQGSTGHRRNMLNRNAEEIGIGVAANRSGRLYWVMVLGARR